MKLCFYFDPLVVGPAEITRRLGLEATRTADGLWEHEAPREQLRQAVNQRSRDIDGVLRLPVVGELWGVGGDDFSGFRRNGLRETIESPPTRAENSICQTIVSHVPGTFPWWPCLRNVLLLWLVLPLWLAVLSGSALGLFTAFHAMKRKVEAEEDLIRPHRGPYGVRAYRT